MTVPAKLLSDELASRRGRKPASVSLQPPAKMTPDAAATPTGPMVKLGPGQIGTSGAFQFGVPYCGIVHLRILGTGAVVNLQFQESGSTWALNSGVALTAGAFFEFNFAVDGAETLFVSGTSLTQAAAFWRPQ